MLAWCGAPRTRCLGTEARGWDLMLDGAGDFGTAVRQAGRGPLRGLAVRKLLDFAPRTGYRRSTPTDYDPMIRVVYLVITLLSQQNDPSQFSIKQPNLNLCLNEV